MGVPFSILFPYTFLDSFQDFSRISLGKHVTIELKGNPLRASVSRLAVNASMVEPLDSGFFSILYVLFWGRGGEDFSFSGWLCG